MALGSLPSRPAPFACCCSSVVPDSLVPVEAAVGYYFACTGYLSLHAVQHDVLPAFRFAMVAFVVRLTVLTRAAGVVRSLRGVRPRGAQEPSPGREAGVPDR